MDSRDMLMVNEMVSGQLLPLPGCPLKWDNDKKGLVATRDIDADETLEFTFYTEPIIRANNDNLIGEIVYL